MRVAIITISDTRDERNDPSGDRLEVLAHEAGAESVERQHTTDDLAGLTELLRELTTRGDLDIIFTTGGTGLGPRDNTPEATRAVITKEAPGLAEAMRRETARKTPTAIISRGVCGIAGSTLIVNLPGSTRGVEECFAVLAPVLSHAVAQLRGDTRH